MKKQIFLILCIFLTLFCFFGVHAEEVDIAAAQDELEAATQFPFLAETNELAVNIRAQADTKSEKVGRLERGTQLTVTGAEIGAGGDLFYRVCLEDGTEGFVRSDLLIASHEMEALQEEGDEAVEDKVQLIGNRNSKKYHEPTCHALPAEKNRVYFDSADEAEAEGYVHCRTCD